MKDWEARIAEVWASIDDFDNRAGEFRVLIDGLAAKLPDGDPVAAFERACAWDSTGHSDRAAPLYRWALDHGLTGYRRRRAVALCLADSGRERAATCGTQVSLLRVQ